MEEKKDVLILGIESSCDETAASVVKNGRTVLSNVISSQIELHKLYGGVVPEIASRKHIEKINQVITEALEEANVTLDDLDAIAVTYGPGLVGALLVGVAEAKAISYAKNLPLVGVHHIEWHISANYIEHPDLEPPFACLVVSGGHTHLVVVKDYGKYEILGLKYADLQFEKGTGTYKISQEKYNDIKKKEGVDSDSEFKFTLYKNDLLLVKETETKEQQLFRFLSRTMPKQKHYAELKPYDKQKFEGGEALIKVLGNVANGGQCIKGLGKSNISIYKVRTDVLGNQHIIKNEGDKPKLDF